jgi:hypothetical protein
MQSVEFFQVEIALFSTILAIIFITISTIWETIKTSYVKKQKRYLILALLVPFTMVLSFTFLFMPNVGHEYYYPAFQFFVPIQISLIPYYLLRSGKGGIPVALLALFLPLAFFGTSQTLKVVVSLMFGVALYYALSDFSYRDETKKIISMFIIPVFAANFFAGIFLASIFPISSRTPAKKFTILVFGLILFVGFMGQPFVIYKGPLDDKGSYISYVVPEGGTNYKVIYGKAITWGYTYIITKTIDVGYYQGVSPNSPKDLTPKTVIDLNIDWLSLFTILFLSVFLTYYFERKTSA